MQGKKKKNENSKVAKIRKKKNDKIPLQQQNKYKKGKTQLDGAVNDTN